MGVDGDVRAQDGCCSTGTRNFTVEAVRVEIDHDESRWLDTHKPRCQQSACKIGR